MTLAEHCRYLNEIRFRVGQLSDQVALDGKRPTSDQLRGLICEIERYKDAVADDERHAEQAADMERNPDAPVEWFGDICTFAKDMVFHANRLGRDVRGTFNDKRLLARPGSRAEDIVWLYGKAQK